MKLVFEVSDIEKALNDFAKANNVSINLKVKETKSNSFEIVIGDTKKETVEPEQVKNDKTPEPAQQESKPVSPTELTSTPKNIFGQPTSVNQILG
jgi:hypothetical protein